jgi:uncharacterized membrane protein
MTTNARILAAAVLAAFGGLTGYALATDGYDGFRTVLSTLTGWMLLADLTIALALVLAWVWQDARVRGVSVLPYAVLTATLGSIGPLLYLVRRRDPAPVAGLGRRQPA